MVGLPALVASIITNFFQGLALYLPQFIAGLLLLIIGMIVSGMVKGAIVGLFGILKLDKIAKDAQLDSSFDLKVWPELFGELLRWTVLILFLVAAVETWGISKVGEVLNQLLYYLPNVFVAVVIGLVGIVIGNLTAELVRHSAKGLGAHATGSLSSLARYSIFVFTALVVLHQLGVAADLIRILFTGVVAMIAIAGGLAFGLGGQDTARDVLKGLRHKIEK